MPTWHMEFIISHAKLDITVVCFKLTYMNVLNLKVKLQNFNLLILYLFLSFFRLIDLVHQDLLLADQFSKLKVNGI